jgi:hypothetical protein
MQVRTHAQKYYAALERTGSKKMRVLPRQQARMGGNKHRRTRSSSEEDDDDEDDFVRDSHAEEDDTLGLSLRSSDLGTRSERTDTWLSTCASEPLHPPPLGEDDVGFLFSSWMDEVATDEATLTNSSSGSSPSGPSPFQPSTSAG